jgi:hypothetical protein
MSREVRRVPIDFDWPLGKVWDGYLLPDRFAENACPDCARGYSPQAQDLHDLWWGDVPFDPQSTGSTLLTHETAVVRAFAERSVERAPDFYGTGEDAIVEEASRLAGLWNGQWQHHLAQEDVDALIAADRLIALTHTWTRETGWQKIEPPVTPTATEVNEWSLYGMGHDGINESVVLQARCERDGIELACATCGGRAVLEAYEGQRAEAAAWEPTEPPTGDGYQLWSTVSDGSPVTPVFATAEELIDHLATVGEHRSNGDPEPYRRDAAEATVREGWVPTGFQIGDGPILDGARDADLLPQANVR